MEAKNNLNQAALFSAREALAQYLKFLGYKYSKTKSAGEQSSRFRTGLGIF